MTGLTLLILRIAFLAVLWAFIFAIVYALRSDLFGTRVRRLQEQPVYTPAPVSTGPAAVQSLPTGPPVDFMSAPTTNFAAASVEPVLATRLVITSGAKSGLEIPLGTEPVTIGRSSDSGLQIRDDYTSNHHARLLLWNGEWAIQDLDSTNGTYLDGARVNVPTRVPLDTPVKIGATSFELRR